MISPFRSQADALESALLAAFPVEEIERLRLRSATVHGFQGSEASTVIASLGLADGDGGAARAVRGRPAPVQRAGHPGPRPHDRGHLGRGRSRASSATTWPTPSADPPRPHPARRPVPAWAAGLAAELRRAGHVGAGRAIRSAPWRVDLVLGEGGAARSG